MMLAKYYEVLGVSHDSSQDEIKKAYREIALSCHPDKLTKMPDGISKQQKIEKFKDATIAYEILMNKSRNEEDLSQYESMDWKDIWSNFFSTHVTKEVIIDTFFDIANTFVKSKVIPKSDENKVQHNVSVEVSYKEVLLNSKKKLRLILVDIDNPIFVEISCGSFPKITKEYTDDNDIEHDININIKLKKKKGFDHIYCENTGCLDIITSLEINLLEYIHGCKKEILYIDDNFMTIDINPFPDSFFIIPCKGIKNGSFIVNISIKNISLKEWNLLNEKDKSDMVRYLNKIYSI